MQFIRDRRFRGAAILSVALLAPALLLSAGEVTAGTATADWAARALAATGDNGGLILHIGCGDGKLTAALRVNDHCIVRGLDTDPANVQHAREYIHRQRIYGPVSVAQFNGKKLPYADNTVNLIVAENLKDVTVDEAMRVLAPNGILYTRNGQQWEKSVKPRPENIDEWTHYFHDSSGNPVAHDRRVGPPRYLQWLADARHGRSHEHTPATSTVVSANGRIFYIHDDGPIAAVHLPSRWYVVARDAFNGTLLWKRPIKKWCSQLMIWTWAPKPVNRRMVAVADRVFVTLGFHAPVSVLDAATGKTLKVYEDTRGTEEILYHNGVLLLKVREVTEERLSALQKLLKLGKQDDSPLYARKTNRPVVKKFRKTERNTKTSIKALDADTGKLLWKKDGEDTAGLRPLTLCAANNRVLYQKHGNLPCFDVKTGEKLWESPWAPIRMVYNDTVVCVNKKIVKLLSAKTGKTLWNKKCSLANVRDAFVAGGDLWTGGFRPVKEKRRSPAWGSYFAVCRDLDSGQKLTEIEAEDPAHHHRCYLNKATDNYILSGRRGTEFLDLSTGQVLWNSWARGVCRYGVMPCNGLLYAPPHACGCYTTAKLEGFSALASGDVPSLNGTANENRIQRGSAYRSIESAAGATSSDDWPMYRSDPERSAATATTVPATIETKWRTKVGDTLTPPTIADGTLFAASKDKHTVFAIDADTGERNWQFTAGSRVDTPPTFYRGQAIFGCRDGNVYSLRAADGNLAWRLQAARRNKNIVVRQQVESKWPVFGSVLIDRGVAYILAGRSSYIDGGMDIYRVEPETGEILSKNIVYSPDPKTGRQPQQFGPWGIPGSRADILSADDDHIYLRQMVFDRKCNKLEDNQFKAHSGKQANPHILTLTDFLDDTWSHRSYWIFGTHTSLSTGCSGRERNLTYGRLIAFDDSTVYGYGRKGVHWSNQLQDGRYRVFALNRKDGQDKWQQNVPIHVRAMILADDLLFVAGPNPANGADWWLPNESENGMVCAISISDGTVVAKCPLDAVPVFDGMAAAGGQLYISLTDGNVVCMGGA